MKKIFLILICLIFSSGLAFAEHGTKNEKKYGSTQPQKMKGKNKYKSGFYSCVNGKFKHKSGTKVKDPQNTILIIYNHGGGFGQPDQKEPDRKSRLLATCGLGGIEIGGKTTIVWNNKKMGGGGKWGGGGPGTKIWEKCRHYPRMTMLYGNLEDYEKNLASGKLNAKNDYYQCIMTDFNTFKRYDKTVEIIKEFIDQGVPPKQIFLIGISAGGTDAVRLAANEGGKLIGGAIAVDPGMGNNQYPAGGIYYHIMSEVNHGANPIPLLFMNSDSTDIQSYMAHYSKNLWVKERGGEMIRLPEYEGDNTEFFLDGVECKIKRRADRSFWSPTGIEKKAHGHQFFFSACFPHYNPQIIDFITRRLQ